MPDATPEQRKKKADVLSEAMKSLMKASHFVDKVGETEKAGKLAERARGVIPVIQRLRA